MKKIFFYAIFLILLSAGEVFAQSIVLTDYPESSLVLEQFEVGFAATGLEPNIPYYVKARIGASLSEMTKAETFNDVSQVWLGDSDTWTTMPSFGANDAGNLDGILKVRAKENTILGDNFLNLRFRKVGTEVNVDSQEVTITVLASPSSTPTIVPTATLIPISATPTNIPVTKAVYRINEARDSDGNVISNVEIYIDGNYTHHFVPETLEFCTGCHCDQDKDVDCELGQHTVKLKKDNYADWSENKTLSAGNNFEVNPILSKSSSTATPTPTSTPKPTSTSAPSPTPKPTNTPTNKPSPTLTEDERLATESSGFEEAVLGTESAEGDSLPKSLSEESQISNTKSKNNNLLKFLPYLIITAGLGLIGFSVFSLLKSKGGLPKQTLV